MKITCNQFVKRQTAESPFSYFDGPWDRVVEICETMFSEARTGYRPGVLLVTVPPERFYSGVVMLDATTPLQARFASRRDGEAPFIEVLAAGAKTPAAHVELVLYSRALLDAENESGDADFEIVSINARATGDLEPMTPIAMARNFLGAAGGTKADYTAEEFARSIDYWSRRAMSAGTEKP